MTRSEGTTLPALEGGAVRQSSRGTSRSEEMRLKKGPWKPRTLFVFGILAMLAVAYGDGKGRAETEPGRGLTFLYRARKLGIPILQASIKIRSGLVEQNKPLLQMDAHIESLPALGLLFRINNHFTSVMEAETLIPIRYVKVIDQEGLLRERKNYTQTILFDPVGRKAILEKKGENKRVEVTLPASTYDPLSVFARCYLREDLEADQDIRVSLYDGVKPREMVFHSTKERVDSKMFGEVETIRLESSTTFSSFGEKEGIIRIWFTTGKAKWPLSIELDLPAGDVKFELEGVEGN